MKNIQLTAIIFLIILCCSCIDKNAKINEIETKKDKLNFSLVAYALNREAALNAYGTYSGTYIHLISIFNNTDSSIFLSETNSGLNVSSFSFFMNNGWARSIGDNFKFKTQIIEIAEGQFRTFIVEDLPIMDSVKLEIPIYLIQDTSKAKEIIPLLFGALPKTDKGSLYDLVQYKIIR